MLDVHGHNPPLTWDKRFQGMNGTSLTDWIHRHVGIPQVQVKSRLRGNNLHILLESKPCPELAIVMPRLIQALSANAIAGLLPPGSSPVYRVIVYGRLPQQSVPAWTEAFMPEPPDRQVNSLPAPLEQAAEGSRPALTDGVVPESQTGALAGHSVLDRARDGQPSAIARHLSETFSNLGIAVRAKLDRPKHTPPLSTPSDPPDTPSHLKRLIIICESAYSPDPLLLAEPIAQRLRALDLAGFQDAVVFGQVAGEARPEWVLRVDLTPPDHTLKEWAHWGDVQAITRLLNRTLLPQQVQISALLKDATLHLTCRSTQDAVPDKLATLAAVVPLLESLSPQGIRAATIYGFASQEDDAVLSTTAAPAPLWVHWLDLLAAETIPTSTLTQAQQGNLDAITFLLTRLLNPDLDRKLMTGGIRVQVRQKGDLLHIMSEALTCPHQGEVGSAIARFLKPLQIPAIAGIRVYGRRSGQKQPLWSYGVDFASRDRLVPEATPEFAVSDAYVGDLLSPPGALALRPEQPSEASRSLVSQFINGAVQRVQRSLLWSQLFIPSEPDQFASGSPLASHSVTARSQRGMKVAAVWSAVGILLIVQSDWLLGQWLQPAASPPAAAQPSPSPSSPPSTQTPSEPSLPNLSLQKTRSGEKSIFSASGFTQSHAETPPVAAQPDNAPTSDDQPLTSIALPASSLRPKADTLTKNTNAYPTLNSHQLDEKLALYQTYLAEHGAPDILVIGSSRALRGIDPIALQNALVEQGYPKATVFNFGVNGATAQVVDLIVRQLLPQDRLPKLILWADGARAFNSGRVDVTFNGILASEGYKTVAAGKPPIPGMAVAQAARAAETTDPAQPTAVVNESSSRSLSAGYQTVNQSLNQRLGSISTVYAQRDRLKTLLRDNLFNLLPKDTSTVALGHLFLVWNPFHAIAPSNLGDATSPSAAAANVQSSVLSEGQSMIDVDGFLPLSNRFNPATYYQKYSRVNGDYDSDYEAFDLEGKQTQALTNLLQFSQTHQIPLIFVNLPLTNDYLDPTRKRHEEDFQQHMLRLAPQLGFVYRDLNQFLANRPEYFSDPSHLNRYGAYEVSRRLATDAMIPWTQTQK